MVPLALVSDRLGGLVGGLHPAFALVGRPSPVGCSLRALDVVVMCAIAILLRKHVLDAQACFKARHVAMDEHERTGVPHLAVVDLLVGVTLARALHAVDLALVREEPVAEVRANDVARSPGTVGRLGDEPQMLILVLLAECGCLGVDEQARCVIMRVFGVGEMGDAVCYGREAGFGHLLQISGKSVALVRLPESGLGK